MSQEPLLKIQDIVVPLDEFVEAISIKAAWVVIDKHIPTCGIKDVTLRLQKIEGRFNILLGAIIGSGALGGAVGAVVQKILSG